MRILLFLLCLPGLASASEASLQKIASDHGLSLALSGMLIVFTGLASISIFIAVLPKVLGLVDRKEKPSPVPVARPAPVDGLDDETLTAIAMVLHAEAERSVGSNLKVTMGLNTSPWALSSQMRVLPGRIKS